MAIKCFNDDFLLAAFFGYVQLEFNFQFSVKSQIGFNVFKTTMSLSDFKAPETVNQN